MPPMGGGDVTAPIRTGAALADQMRAPMAAMARGGAVRGYAGSGKVSATGGSDTGVSMEDWRNAIGDADNTGGDDTSSAGGLSAMDPRFIGLIKQMMADSGKPTSEDKGLALAQAGFGMAASASPHFGQALGEGATQGIKALQDLRKERALQSMKAAALGSSVAQFQEGQQTKRDIAKQASLDREEARKSREDLAREGREAAAARADADREMRAQIAAGNHGIQALMAQAALDRAAAAKAGAPTGVTKPTKEQAVSAGIPFDVPSPYANVSPKAQEDIYKSNQKLFESSEIKNALTADKNRELKMDLERFRELNDKGISGPSNEIAGVGRVKTWLNPDLQEMDSLTARLVPTMRQGLPGAASDLDVAMFKKAGVQKTVDKQVNANRIAALKSALDNQDDKAQFDRDFFSVHNHMQGAEKAWKKYLNANPIFLHNKKNSSDLYELNPDRKTYREYFGGAARATTLGEAKEDPLGIR